MSELTKIILWTAGGFVVGGAAGTTVGYVWGRKNGREEAAKLLNASKEELTAKIEEAKKAKAAA